MSTPRLMTEKDLLDIVDGLIRDAAYNRPAAIAIGMAVGAAVEAEVRQRLRTQNETLKRDLQYARDGMKKGRTRMREDIARLAAALKKIEAGDCIDPRTVAREALGPNVL